MAPRVIKNRSRRRPSKHVRNVRTKKGRRRVVVNRHIRPRAGGTINSSERKIFNHISDPSIYNKEYGGGLDFNKKGELENINMVPGKHYEIEIQDDDYEAIYHTHPTKLFTPPSPEDIQALLENDSQQAEIVFQKGRAFIITKTHSTKALSKLPATQLSKKLDKAYSLIEYKPNWEQKWKRYLEDLGFIVRIDNNTDKALHVKIKPKERRK